MTVSQNCMHGSTLAPPRLTQVKETVTEYFTHATCNDEYFQFWLPHLVTSLKLDVDVSAEGADKAYTPKQTLPSYLVFFTFVSEGLLFFPGTRHEKSEPRTLQHQHRIASTL